MWKATFAIGAPLPFETSRLTVLKGIGILGDVSLILVPFGAERCMIIIHLLLFLGTTPMPEQQRDGIAL